MVRHSHMCTEYIHMHIMYVYIYIYIYIYTHMHVCSSYTYTRIYIYIYVLRSSHAGAKKNISIYRCVRIEYTSMCIYVHMCSGLICMGERPRDRERDAHMVIIIQMMPPVVKFNTLVLLLVFAT